MSGWVQDVRYGLRILAKSPGFTAAALLMGAVLLLASYLPARRAAKVDATVALRYE